MTSRPVRSIGAAGAFLDLEHTMSMQMFVDDDDGEQLCGHTQRNGGERRLISHTPCTPHLSPSGG